MKLLAWTLAVIAVVAVVGSIVAAVFGIWTVGPDAGRFGATAALLFFIGLVSGAAAGLTFDEVRQ
jgi:hypothetical protein